MWYSESDKEALQSSSPNVFNVAIAAVLALHTVLPTSFVAMSPVASLNDYGLMSFQTGPSCSF